MLRKNKSDALSIYVAFAKDNLKRVETEISNNLLIILKKLLSSSFINEIYAIIFKVFSII